MMNQERIKDLAKLAGMNASKGKTDKDGKYTFFINALGKDVPIEWLEKFAALIEAETKGKSDDK